MGLGNGSEFFWLLFLKRVKRFEEKLNIWRGKQELAAFVPMLGENPTILKLAVDNVHVNLSFCDLRDFSACLLLRKTMLLIA